MVVKVDPCSREQLQHFTACALASKMARQLAAQAGNAELERQMAAQQMLYELSLKAAAGTSLAFRHALARAFCLEQKFELSVTLQ